jgi:hypothetical protein
MKLEELQKATYTWVEYLDAQMKKRPGSQAAWQYVRRQMMDLNVIAALAPLVPDPVCTAGPAAKSPDDPAPAPPPPPPENRG